MDWAETWCLVRGPLAIRATKDGGYPHERTCNCTYFKHICSLLLVHRPKGVLLVQPRAASKVIRLSHIMKRQCGSSIFIVSTLISGNEWRVKGQWDRAANSGRFSSFGGRSALDESHVTIHQVLTSERLLRRNGPSCRMFQRCAVGFLLYASIGIWKPGGGMQLPNIKTIDYE